MTTNRKGRWMDGLSDTTGKWGYQNVCLLSKTFNFFVGNYCEYFKVFKILKITLLYCQTVQYIMYIYLTYFF